MRILIADDHELFLKGLEFMLENQFPDSSIIKAENYTELFSILNNLHNFDLIITDLAMPGANSLEGIKKIHNLSGDTPIIILSAVFDTDIINKTLETGVSGYILKASANKDITDAINLVLSGGAYIPQEVLNQQNNETDSLLQLNPSYIENPDFTERQLDVLQKIVEGKSNKQIAYELNLSEGTVKCYITAILKKLNVLNRTSAGLKAVKLGLVSAKK